MSKQAAKTKAAPKAAAKPADPVLDKPNTEQQRAHDAKVAAEDGPSPGKAFTLPTFRVEVVKDAMMKTSVRVYEHEIAILEDIHGADNVVVDENSEKPLEALEDAGAEHERLLTRFGRNGQKSVEKVYPSAAAVAAATGQAFGGGRARAGRRNASAETQQSSQRGAGAD